MGICNSLPEEEQAPLKLYEPQIKLKDFKIIKIIGMGTFGKVFQVKKRNTGKLFAMKVLNKATLEQQSQILYTKTERKVLERVQSDFIVHLCYAFQSEERLYMIMDYMGGGELFYYLHKIGSFSEHIIQFYAAEILLGLDVLHKNSIIYRDLKPQNILLDNAGHIKIADFGLSKIMSSIANEKAYTICGTLDYLAPEVITESGHSKAADWWSYVITYYRGHYYLK